MWVSVHRREVLHKGRVFTLEREHVSFEHGVATELEIIRHPGASAIVALTERGGLLMLRQYRHAIGSDIWEIPAGTLTPGEDPLKGAQRELLEETGFVARNWRQLGEILPVPGYSDERIHLYAASSLVSVAPDLDHDEVITVHELTPMTAFSMIKEGAIQDAKTIAALFLAEELIQVHTTAR